MGTFLREAAAYSVSGPSEISEVSPAGCHHDRPVVSSLTVQDPALCLAPSGSLSVSLHLS